MAVSTSLSLRIPTTTFVFQQPTRASHHHHHHHLPFPLPKPVSGHLSPSLLHLNRFTTATTTSLTRLNAIEEQREGQGQSEETEIKEEEVNESSSSSSSSSSSPESRETQLGSEIREAMMKKAKEEETKKKEDLWSGVAEEIKEIEWPAFGKVVGTTGVVLGVIAGSSVVLLTVNALLAELSDRVFAGRGVQDFFG